MMALGACTLGLGLVGVTIAAQGPAGPAPIPVVVIGCVQPAEAPEAPASRESRRYVLSKITLAAEENHRQDPTGDLLREVITAYRLEDSAETHIASYVGSRVEVTGVIVVSQKPLTDGAANPPATGSAPMPLLRVTRVRPIAADAGACRIS
jgi:hypothetical protein